MCEVYKFFVQHAKQRLSFLNNVITRSCQIFSMCWKSFKRLHRFSQAKDRQTADGKTMANALSKPRLSAVEKGWFLRSGRIYLKKRLYRPWFSCWTKQLNSESFSCEADKEAAKEIDLAEEALYTQNASELFVSAKLENWWQDLQDLFISFVDKMQTHLRNPHKVVFYLWRSQSRPESMYRCWI